MVSPGLRDKLSVFNQSSGKCAIPGQATRSEPNGTVPWVSGFIIHVFLCLLYFIMSTIFRSMYSIEIEPIYHQTVSVSSLGYR